MQVANRALSSCSALPLIKSVSLFLSARIAAVP